MNREKENTKAAEKVVNIKEKKKVITNQETIEKIDNLTKPMVNKLKRKEVKEEKDKKEVVKEEKTVVKEKKTDKPAMVKSTTITEEETMIEEKVKEQDKEIDPITMEKKEKEMKEERKVIDKETEVKVKNIEENLIKDNQKKHTHMLKNRVIMLNSLLRIKSLNDVDYLLYLIISSDFFVQVY